jgi:hypothetical protein
MFKVISLRKIPVCSDLLEDENMMKLLIFLVLILNPGLLAYKGSDLAIFNEIVPILLIILIMIEQ